MAYESHLAPPPHLTGLRIAALDALRDEPDPERGAAVVVAGAVALAEKVPDPDLRPHGFAIDKGELLDLEETAGRPVAACGYHRVDQVEERGQFALRGDILDVYPATEERAVRCELFDIEVEAAHVLLHLHPAIAGGGGDGRHRARGRAGARAPRAWRRWRRVPRKASALTWPRCCPWTVSARCWFG